MHDNPYKVFMLFSCRVPSGRSSLMSECHGSALDLRNVNYADVATSRHSSNKFGSALDFRNVINSLKSPR